MGGLDAPKICTNMYHDLGDKKKGDLFFHLITLGAWLELKLDLLVIPIP